MKVQELIDQLYRAKLHGYGDDEVVVVVDDGKIKQIDEVTLYDQGPGMVQIVVD